MKTVLWKIRAYYTRFWILASHHEGNFFAAGDDSGLIVAKVKNERPAFVNNGDVVLYVKRGFLRAFNYLTQKDVKLMIHVPMPSIIFERVGRYSISYSPSTDQNAYAILISLAVGGQPYSYVHFNNIVCNHCPEELANVARVEEVKGGAGSGVFVAPNMFAVIGKEGDQVIFRNLEGEVVKKCALPIQANAIYSCAATGEETLLCRSGDGIFLFNYEKSIVLGKLGNCKPRHIVWSNNLEYIALVQKYSIVMADKKLVKCSLLKESVAIKGGAWTEDGIFMYTTLFHIKYWLPNGENGIIKTLDAPLYITRVCGNTIFGLNRKAKICLITFDSTECALKLLLSRKRHDKVIDMIMKARFCPMSMIKHLLQDKDFLASHSKSTFEQSICKRLTNLALNHTRVGSDENVWKNNMDMLLYKVGEENLQKGCMSIAEYAYQSTNNIEKLSFIYLITGKLDNLSIMLKRAGDNQDDVMARFCYALFLGDVREHVNILKSAGHLPLAYITASVHGLHDIAEDLAAQLGKDAVPSIPKGKPASLLIPPKPVLRGNDWPMLVSKPASVLEEDWGRLSVDSELRRRTFS